MGKGRANDSYDGFPKPPVDEILQDGRAGKAIVLEAYEKEADSE